MKFALGLLFFVGSAHMAFGNDWVNVFQSIAHMGTLLVEYGFSGYNPNLTSEQVVHFYCAKPSDKIFRPVYYEDSDMDQKLDMSLPMGFATHGWTDNGNSTWMVELSQAWVNNHKMNVCRYDWSIYSMVEYIVAALRNVNLVAAHVVKFLKYLHDKFDIEYSDVILIGHSLGAQISGRIGHLLQRQIGRIIALDPAGPLFTFPVESPDEYRLDRNDTQFLTVVHSNNWIAGVGYSIGHADFYVHGGVSIQPGCVFPLLFGTYSIDIDPITCSHCRSIRLVELSMANDPNCVAVKCDSKLDYIFRTCTNITDTWGISSKLVKGDFYFFAGMKPKCTGKFWAIQ